MTIWRKTYSIAARGVRCLQKLVSAAVSFLSSMASHLKPRIRGWSPGLYIWIGLFLLVISAAISARGQYLQHGRFSASQLFLDFYANIASEIAGMAVTILFIDAISRRRTTQQEMRSLVLQMGSPNNVFAVEAVRVLRAQGWLDCKALRGAHLVGANLQNANLEHMNLQQCNLQGANLVNTNLLGASLQEASLRQVTAQHADFPLADLRGCTLYNADLSFSIMDGSDLRGAVLQGADLQGVQGLDRAKMNERTILPDGSRWTLVEDMARFTDTCHPAFWRSHAPESPARASDSATKRPGESRVDNVPLSV